MRLRIGANFNGSPPMSDAYVRAGEIEVDPRLHEFVCREVLPGTGLDAATFWGGFATLVARFSPRNAALLQQRNALQARIDDWHRSRPGVPFDATAYRQFLLEIGYLVPDGGPFTITTTNVDAEIAEIAGPQLVVPVNNARYALNAANARWGSLYDALYGSDVIPETGETARGTRYNAKRGEEVVRFVRELLDRHFPLVAGSHREALAYRIGAQGLEVLLPQGPVALSAPDALAGFLGDRGSPTLVLLERHGLHLEIRVDRTHPIGAGDAAGVSDVILEAALTTIQDCEDAVAAVNATEKVQVYRNWLGLMRGTLEATLEKGARPITRRLAPDRHYRTLAGGELTLPGRSLMLVRNVGSHMMTDAVRLRGEPIPESFLDAAITTLIALHDLRPPQSGPGAPHAGPGAPDSSPGAPRNSRRGSIYIVKPKMHGPDEVRLADELFAAVEDLLGLPRLTVKIGVMDEERRTSVNLRECIRAVRERIVFINTGFLDRTGDEIHTSMQAGAVPPKGELRKARWLDAYERSNVAVGLACGLAGRAQIGKGMWAMPDRMAEMLATKGAQLRAGANTAWVPSPTAATLHALHYLEVDVPAVQAELARRPESYLAEMLEPALLSEPHLAPAAVEAELDLNAQSILGYVVRWIEFGIGCSKVPDTHNVALMEDRATLRISSQLLANWLRWGLCSAAQVRNALERMARVVDEQNAADPAYRPMSGNFDRSLAFKAACDLIFEGTVQPNGYTESILTARRRESIAANPGS
jgi:malate synthase